MALLALGGAALLGAPWFGELTSPLGTSAGDAPGATWAKAGTAVNPSIASANGKLRHRPLNGRPRASLPLAAAFMERAAFDVQHSVCVGMNQVQAIRAHLRPGRAELGISVAKPREQAGAPGPEAFVGCYQPGMKSLRERLLDVPQVGVVCWIGVRGEHGAAMSELERVEAIERRGLQGDVAARGRIGGNRQVTLLQAEHLPVLAALCRCNVKPDRLRRNLLVSGVNLLSLAKLEFQIGQAVLRGTGPCTPCSKMDDELGPGGFQALRGHGGITAQVVGGGLIRVGDRVQALTRP